MKLNQIEDINLKKLKDFDIILIGELHGWDKSINIIKKVIKNIKVKFFLHELFEDYNITPKEASECIKFKKWRSKIFTYKNLKALMRIIVDLNISCYGSDLRNHGIKNIKKYYIIDRELTKEEEKEENKLVKKREEKQANIIINYLRKNNPIIAVTGAYHLRNNSFLIDRLAKLNKKIVLIYPELRGEIFYGQEELDFKVLEYKMAVLNS